ncbi:MAG: PDZ domain-containing protein, partial [candidate division Zixibacteria bacterium]|nr:PDZ domain-containing protein [candidate division Zixibacteria bacterium]
GVLITEVSEDSPAEKAGLKAGDVIIAIGDEEISDYSDVKEIVSESDEGDKLTFTILRNKRQQKIEVEVAESNDISFGYRYFTAPDIAIIPEIPKIPDIDIYVPKVRGSHNRFNRDDNGYFDYDEFLEEMGEFKEDMAEFKKEMKDLNWKFKRLEKEDRRELKAELDKLRKELKEMGKKLD